MRHAPLLVGVLILLVLPSGAAHTDSRVTSGEESWELGPGESRSLAFSIHYHRLFGTLDVERGESVRVAAYSEEAFHAFEAGGSPAPVWERDGISGKMRFNVLIECCDDATWSPFHLVVQNEHPSKPARVVLSAKATHDDLLVGFAGIEGGPFWVFPFFWVPTAFLTYRVREAALGRGPAAEGDARRLLRASLVAAFGSVAALVGAGLVGDRLYGGGVIGGMVAAFGAVFPSFGVVALTLFLTVAWGYAGVFWLRAYRAARGRDAHVARLVVAVGLLSAFTFLVLPYALVVEYGARVLPVAPLTTVPLALTLGAASVYLALRLRVSGNGGRQQPGA